MGSSFVRQKDFQNVTSAHVPDATKGNALILASECLKSAAKYIKPTTNLRSNSSTDWNDLANSLAA